MTDHRASWLLVAMPLLLLCVALPSSALPLQPRRPDQEGSLIRAAFADGRLWLLSDAGVVSTITPGSVRRDDVTPPEPAVDLFLCNAAASVVTCRREGCTTWTLRRWDHGGWTVEATVRAERDEFVGVVCSPDVVTVLTTQRLIELRPRTRRVVPLSAALTRPGFTSLLATADFIVVGINAGEWGGGILRIDRRMGVVTTIKRGEADRPCRDSLLDADCDPVTAMSTIPWKPDCIALAVGLVHFRPRGRLVEMCGNLFQVLYETPLDLGTMQTVERREVRLSGSVAFFGLARAGNALLAAGIDGLYRLGSDGTATRHALPAFSTIDGIEVSFADPDVVLVLTTANRRHSVGSAVPMLVPR